MTTGARIAAVPTISFLAWVASYYLSDPIRAVDKLWQPNMPSVQFLDRTKRVIGIVQGSVSALMALALLVGLLKDLFWPTKPARRFCVGGTGRVFPSRKPQVRL